MIYIDILDAMKLLNVLRFSSTDLLTAFGPQSAVLPSVLIEVELVRATRRSAPEKLDRAAEVLRGIGAVTLAPSVVARASEHIDVNLRALDATTWPRPGTWSRRPANNWTPSLHAGQRTFTVASRLPGRRTSAGVRPS